MRKLQGGVNVIDTVRNYPTQCRKRAEERTEPSPREQSTGNIPKQDHADRTGQHWWLVVLGTKCTGPRKPFCWVSGVERDPAASLHLPQKPRVTQVAREACTYLPHTPNRFITDSGRAGLQSPQQTGTTPVQEPPWKNSIPKSSFKMVQHN